MMALCEAGFRCIAYDRRGHGRSDDPGHGYDYDTLADDLAALVDGKDLRDVTLVTFSGGAGEAVRYLTLHGTGRVGRLAMIAPTTPLLAWRADHPHGIDPAVFDAFRRDELAKDFPAWLAASARDFGGPGVSASMLDWVISMARTASWRALSEFHRHLSETDFRAELQRLGLPVLILQGDQDTTCPLSLTGEASAALIPGARLSVYEGAPHGLPFSHAASVNDELMRFAGNG